MLAKRKAVILGAGRYGEESSEGPEGEEVNINSQGCFEARRRAPHDLDHFCEETTCARVLETDSHG